MDPSRQGEEAAFQGVGDLLLSDELLSALPPQLARSLPAVLANFDRYLSGYPEQREIEPRSSGLLRRSPDGTSAEDWRRRNLADWEPVATAIATHGYSFLCRTALLAGETCSQLNRNAALPAAVTARALVETFVQASYAEARLKAAFDDDYSLRLRSAADAVANDGFLDLVERHLRGTTSSADTPEAPVAAPDVPRMIGFLRTVRDTGTLLDECYNTLCEFAHPNSSAHFAIHEERVGPVGDVVSRVPYPRVSVKVAMPSLIALHVVAEHSPLVNQGFEAMAVRIATAVREPLGLAFPSPLELIR